MEVELFQEGRDCRLKKRVGDSAAVPELSEALRAGMTPVAAYRISQDMLWMDGKGSDGLGPCKSDNAMGTCGSTVRFSAFSMSRLGSSASSGGPATGIASDGASAGLAGPKVIAPVRPPLPPGPGASPPPVAATPAPRLTVLPTLPPLPTLPAWGTLPVGHLSGLITQPPLFTQPPQLPWPVISARTTTTARSSSTWPVAASSTSTSTRALVIAELGDSAWNGVHNEGKDEQKHGAHEVLLDAAALEERLAKRLNGRPLTSPRSIAFDCGAGITNWQYG